MLVCVFPPRSPQAEATYLSMTTAGVWFAILARLLTQQELAEVEVRQKTDGRPGREPLCSRAVLVQEVNEGTPQVQWLADVSCNRGRRRDVGWLSLPCYAHGPCCQAFPVCLRLTANIPPCYKQVSSHLLSSWASMDQQPGSVNP